MAYEMRTTQNRPYTAKGSGKLPTLKAEEITSLFILVGWLGKKRTRDPFACHRCAVEGPHTHECEGVDLVGAA